MDKHLIKIKQEVYDKCDLEMVGFKAAMESQEYDACQFELSGRTIISRSAKITPKKVGQFVTFWKRNIKGVIEPFNEADQFDFYVVNVRKAEKLGQFVFPKAILVKKGMLSSAHNEGKRGFRVYPSWDITTNKQAERTQQWQLPFFYELGDLIDFKKIKALYSKQQTHQVIID